MREIKDVTTKKTKIGKKFFCVGPAIALAVRQCSK
jgi:hypothetical protein